MTPKEALVFFKTRQNLAASLGVNPVTVFYWIKKGFIPIKAQKNIEKITRKKLKISSDLVTLAQIEKFGKNSTKILKISPSTVRKWKRAGYIPFATQRRIYATVKRQEQKYASTIASVEKKKGSD